MSAPETESASEGGPPPPENLSLELQTRENRSQDDLIMTEDDAKTPKVGMKFNSYDELYEFYTNYAREKGFVTMKRRNKCEDGVLRYFTLACARSGMPRNPNINPTRGRRSIKIGCKARINATLGQDGQFFLSLVEIDHNHSVSPSEVILYRRTKGKDAHTKKRMDLNDQKRIPSDDGRQKIRYNQLKACFDQVAVIGSQSEYLCERANLYISEIVSKLTEDKATGENQQITRMEFVANGNKDNIESSQSEEKKSSFIKTERVKSGEDCSQSEE